MATIVNTIITKETGATAAAENITLLNRETTRLGQTSASTGRQFSAQSAGLGGLVAAYAGAAATIFALQQAFSALSKVTAIETLIEGTRSLAREIGSGGDIILARIKDITKGQLSLAESSRASNILLSAGFGEKQINLLADVANRASKALGRTLSDAVERLSRGTAKLEPELLDELGIFTRIEPALEKYAASLNRTVGSLTTFEKRQAFINAVLTEGDKKFSNIDTSLPTNQQSFERLSATLIDLATNFGILIASGLRPLADFLNNNVSNALAGFLLLTGLVASKGVSVLKSAFTNLSRNAIISGDALAQLRLGPGKVSEVKTAAASVISPLDEQLQLRNTSLKKLIPQAEQGLLSIRELKGIEGEITKEIQIRENIVKTKLIPKATQSQDKETKQFLPLTGSQRAAREQIKVQEKSIELLKEKLGEFSEELSPAFDKTAKAGEVLGKVIRGIGNSISFTLSLASKLITGLAIFQILADILGQIFGFKVDIIEFIGKGILTIAEFLGLTSKKAQETTVAVQGLLFGFAQKSELRKELELIGSTISQIDEAFIKSSKITSEILNESSPVFIRQQIRSRKPEVKPLTFLEGAKTQAQPLTLQESQAFLELKLKEELIKIDKKLSKEKDFSERLSLINLRKALELQLKIAETGIFGATVLSKELAPLGITQNQIGTAFANDLLKVNKETETIDLKVGDLTVNLGRATVEGGKLNELFGNTRRNIAAVAITSEEFFQLLNSSGTSAEDLVKKVSAIETRLTKLFKAKTEEENFPFAKLVKQISGIDLSKEFDAPIKFLFEQLQKAKEITTEFTNIEKTTKGIRNIFSSEIALADQAILTGNVGISGNIAKSQEEISLNKAELLAKFIREGGAAESAASFASKLTAEQTAKLELLQNRGRVALSAIFGSYLGINKELQQISLQEEKRLKTLEEQLKVTKLQVAVNIGAAQIELLQTRESGTQKIFQSESQIIDVQNRITQLQFQVAAARIAGGAKILEQQQKIRDIQFDIVTAEEKIAQVRLASNFDKNIKQLEFIKQFSDEFPTLFTKNQKIDIGFKVEEERTKKELAILDREEAFLEKKKEFELNKLDRELEIFKAQQAQSAIQIEAAKSEFEARRQQIEREKEENIRKLKEENNLLAKRAIQFDREKDLQIAQIKSQETNQLLEIDIARKRLQFLVDQEKIFNEFLAGFRDLLNANLKSIGKEPIGESIIKKIAVTNTESFQKSLQFLDTSETKIKENAKTQSQGVEDTNKLRQQGIEDQINTNSKLILDQRKLADLLEKEAGLKKDLAILQALASAGSLSLEEKRTLEAKKLLLANIQLDKANIQAKREDLQLTLDNLKKIAEAQKNVFLNLAVGLLEGLNTGIADSVEKLSKALFEGGFSNLKNGFNDFVTSILDNIRKVVTEQLIIKPLQEFVTKTIGGAILDIFGIESKPDGTFNNRIHVTTRSEEILGVGSSLFSKLFGKKEVNPPADAGQGILDAAKKFNEENKGLLVNFFDNIKSGFSDIFEFLGRGFDSFGEILSSLFRGIFGSIGQGGGFLSFLGLAAGGSVPRFSAGGSFRRFASGGQRDSIIGGLEPGEFILRKEAVSRIGLPAAQAINRANPISLPKVEINFENKGTPQKQEGNPNIKFDGEKMVISLILNDLNQNGPIKQAIKGLRN